MRPDTTAVLFQGLQVDFCSPQGKLYDQLAEQLAARRLVPALVSFLEEALDLGLRAYFVPIVFTPDYRELRQVGGILGAIKEAGAFQAGTPGAEPVEELRPLLDRITVVQAKRGLCAFGSTDLDDRLRGDGIETVAVCGLLTNVCVETTARSAYDLGYEVIVLTDLTAARSPEEQAASERFIFPLLGREMTGAEFLEEVGQAQPVV
ncbi:MAG: cysteine hydrolase [Armatimonadota bacterium]